MLVSIEMIYACRRAVFVIIGWTRECLAKLTKAITDFLSNFTVSVLCMQQKVLSSNHQSPVYPFLDLTLPPPTCAIMAVL